MNKEVLKQLISMHMELAFLSGRWLGQVDLEKLMDNDLSDAFMQHLQIQKDMGVNHSVVIPNTIVELESGRIKSLPDLNCKYVRYKLRSDRWRSGVEQDAKKHLKDASERLFKLLNHE